MALVLDGTGTMTLGNGSITGLTTSGFPSSVITSSHIVDGTIVQKESYFNFDIGASYNYLDFYTHLIFNWINCEELFTPLPQNRGPTINHKFQSHGKSPNTCIDNFRC